MHAGIHTPLGVGLENTPPGVGLETPPPQRPARHARIPTLSPWRPARHVGIPPPPPPDGQTDTCKDLTFANFICGR